MFIQQFLGVGSIRLINLNKQTHVDCDPCDLPIFNKETLWKGHRINPTPPKAVCQSATAVFAISRAQLKAKKPVHV